MPVGKNFCRVDAAALGASRAAASIAIKMIVRRVPRGVAVCDWRPIGVPPLFEEAILK
jgi:hypothetical protein